MRLCFVGPGYYPDRGGAEEYVRAMAERLAKKGHEVHVIVPAVKKAGEERNRVRVHRLHSKSFLSKRLAKLDGLETKLVEINPEVVHIQSHASLYALQTAEACHKIGIKYVVLTYGPTVEHNRGGALRNLFAAAIDWWTTRKIFAGAAWVLYRTPNLINWCQAHGAKRLAQAPTGFEEAFVAWPKQSRNAGCVGKRVIGFVGGLSRRKGALQLVQALPRVLKREPTTLLVFVGGEAEPGFRKELETGAARLGVRQEVQFVGYVNALSEGGLKELIGWFDSVDVFALPSAWEGPSQAMLQAMARGKPVVVARIPQLEGLVSGENGALVEFGDVRGLADAVLGLLKDEKRRAATGDKNREKAAEFTFNQLATELEIVYRKA